MNSEEDYYVEDSDDDSSNDYNSDSDYWASKVSLNRKGKKRGKKDKLDKKKFKNKQNYNKLKL